MSISGFLVSYWVPRGLGIQLNTNGTNPGNSTRCGDGRAIIHAPTQISARISGLYQSILPDNQVATVAWDDGTQEIEYRDGQNPGECDTIISANLLSLADTLSVNWDMHDLSESGNDIGHGLAQDALGMEQCTSRVYTWFFKNRSDSTSNAVIGNSASNEWTGLLTAGSTFTLPPDSFVGIIGGQPAGMSVSSTNCNLKVLSSGGDLNYGLNWCGCSN